MIRADLRTDAGVYYGTIEIDPSPDGWLGLGFEYCWGGQDSRFGIALPPDVVQVLRESLEVPA